MTSPNYPDNYDDDQQCTTTILSYWTRYLDVVDFELELGFDLLNVNGDRYMGDLLGAARDLQGWSRLESTLLH